MTIGSKQADGGTHPARAIPFNRMKAAEAERERKAEAARNHAGATKRAVQIQRIVAMLTDALTGWRKAREHVLAR
ncbi:hypothetical protein [Devosia elaeis]|uniref:hypothetical protein n=1 Tax=Devosia elaeis TaxID=1770058 RepID=UPI0010420A5A|nr:hypothetical protein [Devosia elaeis]